MPLRKTSSCWLKTYWIGSANMRFQYNHRKIEFQTVLLVMIFVLLVCKVSQSAAAWNKGCAGAIKDLSVSYTKWPGTRNMKNTLTWKGPGATPATPGRDFLQFCAKLVFPAASKWPHAATASDVKIQCRRRVSQAEVAKVRRPCMLLWVLTHFNQLQLERSNCN